MKLTHLFFLLWPALMLTACRVMQTPTTPVFTQYLLKDSVIGSDATEIERFLQPYRDSLLLYTGVVIGEAKGNFKKEKPGGSLGNLVVDAMYEEAMKMDPQCTGAMFNYGGMRLPDLMQGPVTRGKLLELLPFDNELVIVIVKGDTLQTWLNHIAGKGGWPVQFENILWSENGKIDALGSDTLYQETKDGALQVLIKKRNIQADSTYRIATIDYIANGGDNCTFLKPCERSSSGKLVRDIVTAYIERKKVIYPDTTRRIQFVR